jgi:hypothetical protein
LDGGQCLVATIALLNADVDVVLGLQGVSGISIGLCKGIDRLLKVLDAVGVRFWMIIFTGAVDVGHRVGSGAFWFMLR